jgi:hypothetical protein
MQDWNIVKPNVFLTASLKLRLTVMYSGEVIHPDVGLYRSYILCCECTGDCNHVWYMIVLIIAKFSCRGPVSYAF